MAGATPSGEIRVWPMPQGSRPYGIELDADQRPWVDLFGTNAIVTIDPATMKERRYELPEGARPRRIAVTSTGSGTATTHAAISAGSIPRRAR